METKKIIKNLLEVITFDKDFNTDTWGDWGVEMKKMISDWVIKNNVENVEFTVGTNSINENLGANEVQLQELTPFKVNTVCTDIDMSRLSELYITPYEGPGWDSNLCEDTRWNNEYFFTGADSAFYILIHKIN